MTMSCLNCCKRLVDAKPAVEKKVTFNETVKVFYFKKVPVEPDVCWQQVVVDRLRFKRRMLDVESKIGWVFALQHRNHIFNMLHSK